MTIGISANGFSDMTSLVTVDFPVTSNPFQNPNFYPPYHYTPPPTPPYIYHPLQPPPQLPYQFYTTQTPYFPTSPVLISHTTKCFLQQLDSKVTMLDEKLSQINVLIEKKKRVADLPNLSDGSVESCQVPNSSPTLDNWHKIEDKITEIIQTLDKMGKNCASPSKLATENVGGRVFEASGERTQSNEMFLNVVCESSPTINPVSIVDNLNLNHSRKVEKIMNDKSERPDTLEFSQPAIHALHMFDKSPEKLYEVQITETTLCAPNSAVFNVKSIGRALSTVSGNELIENDKQMVYKFHENEYGKVHEKFYRNNLTNAIQVFDELPDKDKIAWMTALLRVVNGFKSKRRFNLFEEMFHKDSVVWNTLVYRYEELETSKLIRAGLDKMGIQYICCQVTIISAVRYFDHGKVHLVALRADRDAISRQKTVKWNCPVYVIVFRGAIGKQTCRWNAIEGVFETLLTSGIAHLSSDISKKRIVNWLACVKNDESKDLMDKQYLHHDLRIKCMCKGYLFYSNNCKKARELMENEFQNDKKLPVTIYFSTGIVTSHSITKKRELLSAENDAELKQKIATGGVEVINKSSRYYILQMCEICDNNCFAQTFGKICLFLSSPQTVSNTCSIEQSVCVKDDQEIEEQHTTLSIALSSPINVEVSDDVYLEIVLVFAKTWSLRFFKINIKSASFLKSAEHSYTSWLIKGHREFRCAEEYLPILKQKAIELPCEKQLIIDWLSNEFWLHEMIQYLRNKETSSFGNYSRKGNWKESRLGNISVIDESYYYGVDANSFKKGELIVAINFNGSCMPEDTSEDEHFWFSKSMTTSVDQHLAVKQFSIASQLDFKAVMLVLKRAPLDLYDTLQKLNIKLYVYWGLIIGNCKKLNSEHLSFVNNATYPDHLFLNNFRKVLQPDKSLQVIKQNLVKEFIEMFNEGYKIQDKFTRFNNIFLRNLKLGVNEESQNCAWLAELLKYCSLTKSCEELTNFKEYTIRMKVGQNDIFYVTEDSKNADEDYRFLEKLKKSFVELFLVNFICRYDAEHLKKYDDKKMDTKDKLNFDDENEEEEHKKKLDKKLFSNLYKIIKETFCDKNVKVVVSHRIVDLSCYWVSREYGYSNTRALKKPHVKIGRLLLHACFSNLHP